jgi:serine/threonine-protein kinase
VTEAAAARAEKDPLIIGRYALFDALASGGMATVHLGRLLGPVGFGRTVAVKRLHTQYTTDHDFVMMFMDEARIVACIRHPNVVPMVDVIESSRGLLLVMEYVHGESLSKLLRTCRATNEVVPLKLVTSIMHGVLLGLHAAHETKGAAGELLDVVHRDVSPQNIIVGADGVARVLDFGVAKAAGRAQVTREGQIKGKLAYMAPEQIRGKVDRRADVFAASVVLWEALAGRRLHEGAKDVEIVSRVVQGGFPPPSQFRSDVSPELDAIVMRGLDVDREKRYQNAREMALDLERKIGLANPSEIGGWVERLASNALRDRAERIARMEKSSADLNPVDSVPPPDIDLDEPGSLPSDAGRSSVISGTGHAPVPPSLDSSGISATHSVVSNGATPMATDMPVQPPRPDRAPTIAILSSCAALAIVGAALGGYSLYAGKGATSHGAASSAPPSTSPSPTPSMTSAPSASSAQPDPRTQDRVSADGGVAAQPKTPTPIPSTAPTPMPAPVHRPTATATPQPAPTPPPPKKNCDPPYIVDEQGHRKYKMECMGAD